MGFGGLDITPKGITQIKTALPKQWKSLTLNGIGVDKKTTYENRVRLYIAK
jgi:hypothetical protein